MDKVIQLFNEHNVRYLLIGGQAIRLEGMPRFSMDWDFYIPPKDMENISKINRLLENELDSELLPLGEKGENFIQTYQTQWGILQFHLGGPGLPDFNDAEKQSQTHETEDGIPVKCISGKHLLQSKIASNRPQDQMDIEFLQKKQDAGIL
jgi:hypothetical protein